MTYFAGLDVSIEVTSVCVVDGKGTIVREAKVASSPAAISRWLGDTGLRVARVGLEAGPLAPWLYRGLLAAGLPAVCIETRRMKAFAAASPVKTDRKDARLIAQAIRAGLFRAVHVKSEDSQALRTLLRHRWTLLRRRRDLENEMRGTLKGFGLKLGKVAAKRFAARLRELVAGDEKLAVMFAPMLRARAALLREEKVLHRMVLDAARQDPVCRHLMTAQGVGPITALAYRSGIDLPARFGKSRGVGAYLGLTPRKNSPPARSIAAAGSVNAATPCCAACYSRRR